MFGSLTIYPNYLAYYNELIGGPDHRVYSVSHDMDWGQDLELLAQYTQKNDIQDITLYYFGTADPTFYGINHRKPSNRERLKPEKRVYAISVRYLDSVEWTETREPDAKAGYSIFIYDLRNEE
jgi:hypothetical protein